MKPLLVKNITESSAESVNYLYSRQENLMAGEDEWYTPTVPTYRHFVYAALGHIQGWGSSSTFRTMEAISDLMIGFIKNPLTPKAAAFS